MRIALVGSRSFPASHGGLEVVVEELARSLSQGNAVSVYAGRSVEQSTSSIEVVRSPAVRGKYTHTATQMLSGLAHLKRRPYDVVHIHGVGPAAILLLWPRKNRSPVVVVTAHGLDWERDKWPKAARAIFRQVALAALKRADAVSGVSHQTASTLQAQLGRPVAFITNGVRIPDLSDPYPDLPQKYSVLVSRLTPEKNIESVVRAWTPAVADVHGPLVVIGGGKGSYAKDYERELKEMTNPRVIWTGPLARSQALSTTDRARLFLSMSKVEAQPMAVIEALTLGTRAVLSDIPEHRQVAAEAGYFIPLAQIDSLESHLLALPPAPIYEQQERQRFWTANTWEKVAQQYTTWYASATSLSAQRGLGEES